MTTRWITGLFLIFSFCVLDLKADAQVDPFNTYQWNRGNIIRGNGQVDSRPWFEWWYYKVVIPETNEAFYFVYGVVNPWDVAQTSSASRSYVGMGDFQARVNPEVVYAPSSFSASYTQPQVIVGENYASDRQFFGAIGNKYAWNIGIQNRWTYNSLGWATGRNITNIEWYPAQADALCSGSIYSNGQLRQFSNAPCYQDRNWGSSFPEWWTWIVSNHFEDSPGTALAIGGGKPRYYNVDLPFSGVTVGLKHKGIEYAFRPNDFNPVRMEVNYGTWKVAAENLTHRVEVVAYAPPEKFMDLQFMTPDGRLFHDYEALMGELTVKLYKRVPKGLLSWKWELMETLTSHHAGIEYGSFETQGVNGIQDLFSKNQKFQ